jgi:flagellar protein FliL
MKNILFGLISILIVLPSIGWSVEDEESTKKSSAYISLGTPMILNLTSQKGRLTFLQLQADVLVSDDSVKDEIKIHIPAIRHELIVLLSEQAESDMKSPVKREEIRKIATANVQERIKELANVENMGEILFSNFLVQ